MRRPRIPESEETHLDRGLAEAYDRMQAALCKKGWLETADLLKAGVASGRALEIGSGPGYLGLEWLERTKGTRLVGLDRNAEMVAIAARHALDLGLDDRARHLIARAEDMPLQDSSFDSVFSSRSLHEWLDPLAVLSEIWRILKPGGLLYLSDLRRDLSPSARGFLERRMTAEAVLKGLHASIDAAYTAGEVRDILDRTDLTGCSVLEIPLGLQVTGAKAGM